MAFVVGLVVGGLAGRLIAWRGSSAAPDKVLQPLKPEPEGLVVGASNASDDDAELPAARVDNVVAELERRYEGRRADSEADKRPQGRDV